MQKIEAIINESQLSHVQSALAKAGISGMSITKLYGLGQQEGLMRVYRGVEYLVNFIQKLKLEIIVSDDEVGKATNAITSAARTGEIGDGMVFVTKLGNVTQIRTGQIAS